MTHETIQRIINELEAASDDAAKKIQGVLGEPGESDDYYVGRVQAYCHALRLLREAMADKPQIRAIGDDKMLRYNFLTNSGGLTVCHGDHANGENCKWVTPTDEEKAYFKNVRAAFDMP